MLFNCGYEVRGVLPIHDQLRSAIEYALDFPYYGTIREDITKKGYKLLYHITRDGKYCIGCKEGKIPRGWKEYPFGFDITEIEKDVRKHLNKMELPESVPLAFHHRGFIMRPFIAGEGDNPRIENQKYGVCYFIPITVTYYI